MEKWGDEQWEDSLKSDLALKKPMKGWSIGEVIEGYRRWGEHFPEEALSSATLNALLDFLDLRNATVHPARKKGRRRFEDYAEANILAIVEDVFKILAQFAGPT